MEVLIGFGKVVISRNGIYGCVLVNVSFYYSLEFGCWKG